MPPRGVGDHPLSLIFKIRPITMTTPAEKANAHLNKLGADRRAAIAVSEEKAEEAKLIKARQQGFREAMEILGLQLCTSDTDVEPNKPPARRQRRNIPQLILNELSFSGKAMTTEQIARAVDYTPAQAETVLKRMEGSAKVVRNKDDRWDVLNPTVAQSNGHDLTATN
jgi:hypothetical protein